MGGGRARPSYYASLCLLLCLLPGTGHLVLLQLLQLCLSSQQQVNILLWNLPNTILMADDFVPEGQDLNKIGEEELWELINDNRHRISLGARPGILIPYLRQARVLTEMDEDEILSCHNLTNRSMRTSHMLDLLRTQGRNGAVALLDSLMIHYPTLYTQVTGRKASTEPSRFSGLIKYSELTEYLVRAVTGMQKELQEARCEAGRMRSRCTTLETEIGQLIGHQQQSQCLQSENERMRRRVCSLHQEVTTLKDEKCDLYVRVTAAIEEKSAVNIRLHDLNLQVYQLQMELQKAQTENEYQRRCSLRCSAHTETPKLQEEVRSLRCQLVKAEKLDPARQDILAQDLAEAIDSQVELAEQLRCYREENEKLYTDKQALLTQKDSLGLRVQQLTQDCDMHRQRNSVIEIQMKELQSERDQAYQSRDEAQAMITRVLAEKDTLRCQLVELQQRHISLQTFRSSRDRRPSFQGEEINLERQRSSSVESWIPTRRRLRHMDAINPVSRTSYGLEFDDVAVSSVRSRTAEPPCPESLRRREGELSADSSFETEEPDAVCDDFVLLPNVDTDVKERPKLSSLSGTVGLSRTSPPPFLMRSRQKAIRISARMVIISFQGDALLNQLTVVGGNKTGIFVHQVTDGSPAHTAGISPGAQIVEVNCEQNQKALKMILEDSTLEEAMWAIGQITGLCHLSLRPRQDDYEGLLQQMQNSEASPGDSFYVRVNMSLPAGTNGTLAVSCNDILHVTNTWPTGTEDSWYASKVHPCQLLDLESGTLPNYYRAQRLLIRAIEDMSFQAKKSQEIGREVTQNNEKAVRIVSTGQQGRTPLSVSVEEEKPKSPDSGEPSKTKSCVSLMPYTLVTPHHPPVCRPVLLLPTVLGRVLDKKLASWQGFELCEPEVLSPSELQRSEVLEECEQGRKCCYTLKTVNKVMTKGIHCVLPLGLDCIRRLHRAEIFPIIIFVGQSVRSARKLRSKLQRHSQSEEQLLACSRSEEPLLDKLPCLYHSMAPDSWCDQASLLTRLRTVVWQEQKKIVWVEPDLR